MTQEEKEMQEKQDQALTEPSDSPLSDANNVEKIRDILFGNQIRDFDQKFTQLQDQLSKELNDLRSASKMRLDSLENFVKSEFESLNSRLEGEKKLRTSELEDVSDQLEKQLKLLQGKFLEQELQNNDSARALRQLLLEQSNELFDMMTQKQAEDRELLKRIRDEINTEKVDRSALSSLFTELALQVSGNDLATEISHKKVE